MTWNSYPKQKEEVEEQSSDESEWSSTCEEDSGSRPWLWPCVVVSLVISLVCLVIFLTMKPQQPHQSEIVHSNCRHRAEELWHKTLLGQQYLLPEQNKQMQEWQGALPGQNKPDQKWKEAMGIVAVVVSNLQANLKFEKDLAEKASKQANDWRPVFSGSNTKFIEIEARVASQLKNLETDFETWCETLHTTFNAAMKLLEKKVGKAIEGTVVNIAVENKILQRIMKNGFEGLEEMETKLAGMQRDLNGMPKVALDMGVAVCGNTASNKSWEKGFTKHVAVALDLKQGNSIFVARVLKDLANMRDVTDHLDIDDYTSDVFPLQQQVLPQLKQLLNLLDNHGEKVDMV